MKDSALTRRIVHRHADVIVVGAGIFGSAVATALAQQSRSVFLLERSLKEPDRIVGELLQPGGVQALKELGLEHCLEGIDSIPVHGYQVIYNKRPVSIPYPNDTLPKSESSSSKSPKRQGRSFHHGRFVQNLRAAATAEKNVTIIETEVDSLIRAEKTGQVLGVTSKTKGASDCFFAPLTIIADGYRSKFRSENNSQKPISKSKFWALELQDADLPAPNFGHVILGDFSPVLLYQIGTHETRALVNVPEGLPSAKSSQGGVSQYIRSVVLPQLPESVQPSFSKALDAGRLRCMPNSFLPATQNRVPGLIIAGDALNMRHPLTGGGMTVALNDVVLLKDLLSPSVVPDLGNSDMVLRQLKTFHWRRKHLTSVINILAQALYALFDAEDYYLNILRTGCFEYFKRGGECVRGPAALLSGIVRSPQNLVYHFTSVAILSIWVLLVSQPIWRLPITLYECVAVLVKAFIVIFPYMIAEVGW